MCSIRGIDAAVGDSSRPWRPRVRRHGADLATHSHASAGSIPAWIAAATPAFTASSHRLHYAKRLLKPPREWNPAAAISHAGEPGGANRRRRGEGSQGRLPEKPDRVAARAASSK